MARPIPMIYIVYIGDCPSKVYTNGVKADSIATAYAEQLKAQGRDDIPVTVKCIEESRLRDA